MARFTGKYEYAVDKKGRINVPSPFRKLLTTDDGENSFMLCRGFELCLMAYPMEFWEALERETSRLDYTNDDVRFYMRMLNSNATEHTFDKQGRIILPREVRDWAQIGDNVVIVGGGRTHFEIFSPKIYQEYLDGTFRYPNAVDAKYIDAARKAHATINRLSAS